MPIRIVQVGKTKDKALISGVEHYAKLLSPFVRVKTTTVGDTEKKKKEEHERVKEREGQKLLEQAGRGDTLILLDEQGKTFSSKEFAGFLEKVLAHAQGDITFLIGGPYGVSEEVKKAVHHSLSLSPMTFTHEMTRLILMEQLYRGMTILKGKTYHY